MTDKLKLTPDEQIEVLMKKLEDAHNELQAANREAMAARSRELDAEREIRNLRAEVQKLRIEAHRRMILAPLCERLLEYSDFSDDQIEIVMDVVTGR